MAAHSLLPVEFVPVNSQKVRQKLGGRGGGSSKVPNCVCLHGHAGGGGGGGGGGLHPVLCNHAANTTLSERLCSCIAIACRALCRLLAYPGSGAAFPS